MSEDIKNMIFSIYTDYHINLVDVGQVKRHALDRKMYPLIVYINDNLTDYVRYAKELMKNEPWNC